MAVVDINTVHYTNSFSNSSSLSRDTIFELKRDFMHLVCGQEVLAPDEIQREIMRRIMYVHEAEQTGVVDKDVAGIILRILAADLVGLKLSDILERWSSKESKCSAIRQFVLPGME